MNRILYATAAVFCLMFSSCQEKPDDPNKQFPLRIKAGSTENPAEPQAVTSWDIDGTISIFMLEESGNTPVSPYTNIPYSYHWDTRSFTPATTTIYFPIDGRKVRFVSYFPHRELIDDRIYPIDLATQPEADRQKFEELLWAPATPALDKETPMVQLTFEHQYASIDFKMKNGTGISEEDLKIMTISMSEMYTTANFDVLTGTLTRTGTPGELIFKRRINEPTHQTALVLPTPASATRQAKFTLGDECFIWKIPDRKFEKGHHYTYAVTVSRIGAELEARIEDWIEEDEDSGTAD